MGKHKHRKRERDSEFIQPQMNNGYMNGVNMGINPQLMGSVPNQFMVNGINPAMNMNQPGVVNGQGMNMDLTMSQNSNMGMNQGVNLNNNPISSLLGGILGPEFNGIIQLLNGIGVGSDQNSGLGSLLNLLGGNNDNLDIMQMLSNLLGGSQSTSQNYGDNRSTPRSIDELLDNINPNQMNLIQSLLQGMSGVSNQPQKEEEQGAKVEKKDDSLEDILANLDFNAILNNINNDSNLDLDFSNINLDDIDLDKVTNNEGFEENISEVRDADILEENIVNDGKEFTKDEYDKLINILIKLIDPNKIKLLQKVFNAYEKQMDGK